jgi:hypothetical protein
LNEALGKLEWSPKALARLCFLVLDAPPHEEKQAEIDRRWQPQTAAAEK